MRHAASALDGVRSGSWALDVGAGLGEHAAVWAGRGYRSLALDPGRAMIGSASTRVGVRAIRGRAQHLPLLSGTVALVYFHLSIHYGDWRRSIDEAARVLEPGRPLCDLDVGSQTP